MCVCVRVCVCVKDSGSNKVEQQLNWLLVLYSIKSNQIPIYPVYTCSSGQPYS